MTRKERCQLAYFFTLIGVLLYFLDTRWLIVTGTVATERKSDIKSEAIEIKSVVNDTSMKFVVSSFNIRSTCPKLAKEPKHKSFRVAKTGTNPSYLIALHPTGELISDAIATTGSWEYFGNSAFIEAILKYPNTTIVNVGANLGSFALYFAALGFETHAFEPEATNYNLLECSGRLNHFFASKRLIAHNKAVGNDSKSTVCMQPDTKNMGMSAVSRHTSRCDRPVPVVVLDEYVTANPNSFANHSFTLLIVDVEGFEPFLFDGFQKTLANPQLRPRFIDLELSCYRWIKFGYSNCTDVLNMVLKHGYRVVGPSEAVADLNNWAIAQYNVNPNLLLMSL